MTQSWTARLIGRPLAMVPQALDLLMAAGAGAESRPHSLDVVSEPAYQLTDSGIATLPVFGPLVARGDWLTQLLGASDYSSIVAAADAVFAEPSSRAVVLELDSPGGEVSGLFDLVDRLTRLRKATGKPLWAVANEAALSAAYAIASAADRIYVTRTAEVGSIGVVAAHLDESQADAMTGHKWTLIHAGQHKVDGHAHAPLSAQAHAAVQADVDALHEELVALVAVNRRMTPEAVRGTEAAIYRGRRGIESGLADRLGTLNDALSELSAHLAAELRPPTSVVLPPAMRRQNTMNQDASPEAAAEQVAGPEAVPAAQPYEEAAAPAEVEPAPAPSAQTPTAKTSDSEPSPQEAAAQLRAEYAEIAQVAAQGARLGVTIDAADAMARGTAADALRRSLLETLAARAEANAVVAVTPADNARKESPLVRRARERAIATAQ